MCPPHSPTRITKNSILKLAGAFHCPNTSRIRFWAFSYSMGEPCGRSNQLITYFICFLSSKQLPFGRANLAGIMAAIGAIVYRGRLDDLYAGWGTGKKQRAIT